MCHNSTNGKRTVGKRIVLTVITWPEINITFLKGAIDEI